MPGAFGMMTHAAMGHGNHLLRLAQPVIWVLDELTPELDSAARLETLQQAAHTRLANFRQACRAAALPAEDVEAVHYCLCAALDQAGRGVRGRSGACRGAWLRRGLLAAHYGEADRGSRSRALVARLQQRAGAHADALEVIAYLVGRGLTDADRGSGARVVVVNQILADLWWPNEDPIGRCLKIGGDTVPCSQVVGVAEGFVRYRSQSGTGVAEPTQVSCCTPVGKPVLSIAPPMSCVPGEF